MLECLRLRCGLRVLLPRDASHSLARPQRAEIRGQISSHTGSLSCGQVHRVIFIQSSLRTTRYDAAALPSTDHCGAPPLSLDQGPLSIIRRAGHPPPVLADKSICERSAFWWCAHYMDSRFTALLRIGVRVILGDYRRAQQADEVARGPG